MKRVWSFLVFSILALSITAGFAQTTVTGHVFAEVVESISASNYSHSLFSIRRNDTKGIDFGQIDIKSAGSASCSLILGKVFLTGNNNQHIVMDTSAYSTQILEGNAINGVQSISLQCHPGDSELDFDASEYSGNVNIVLAYN
jgi:hypothetical protein